MQNADILSLAQLRLDGRKYNEIRRIKTKMGVVDRADGSAYYEQGLNKVLVSVHGPQEPLKRDQSEDSGFITVHFMNAPFSGTDRKKRRAGDRRSAEIEQIVKESIESVVMLDLYARSEIVVVVELLESDGSSVCAILNATTLALMDAGISMSDMVVSCSVGFFRHNLCLDLTQMEQGGGGACLPMAVKARTEEVIFVQLDNRLSVDNVEAALNAAIAGCAKVKNILEASIKAHIEDAISKQTE